jgi:hypothetical protein
MLINLLKILNTLRAHTSSGERDYFIPEAWNCCGFEACKTIEGRPGELMVDPYAYMAHHIKKLLEPPEGGGEASESQDPITGHIMFGMLPRTFTAWYHGRDGVLAPGTFLKAICLIPYLKKLNITMIYLLPIFKHSDRYRKGSLGSPYAIKNIYLLDEHLHDDLLGAYSEELLDVEFKAFVEACHISGIKVMVDFVFRTVARDNDLILSHPDWFYWIDAKLKDSFRIPPVENEKEHTMMSDKSLPSLYSSKGIKDYLASFRPAPNVKNTAGWAAAVSECKRENGNILDYAEMHLGVSTVPGFSDVINDNQPLWTDVTYLRYYYDIHEKAQKYISKRQQPYILQDGAKLNLYRGSEKNEELWEYIAGVIPHYQTVYGIDGARIDMGHALPPELNREIVERAKRLNPGFILWSEEFNVKNSGRAKKDGFHFVTSMLWLLYKDIAKPGFGRKLFKTLLTSQVPVTGALETPDTPRSAGTYADRRLLKLLVWLNCFLPNSVPFINNGQELMEVQPMNLGLDNTEEGRFMLDKEDSQYGKLAFFDPYALHWLNEDRLWMTELLAVATGYRRSFHRLITEGAVSIPIRSGQFLSLCFYDRSSGENVFLLANISTKRKKTCIPRDLFADAMNGKYSGCRILNRDAGSDTGPGTMADGRTAGLSKILELRPGEVLLGQFVL